MRSNGPLDKTKLQVYSEKKKQLLYPNQPKLLNFNLHGQKLTCQDFPLVVLACVFVFF